ncbi:valine--tRNA ligase [Buchnera aphidicola]|uniref:Valine--tRNA ligase n=1 Tax=Buchnera aphidicola (Sarucallis kahawaluokalani) TaxID=1241878 RepID=A0A4D6Y8P6_9GAMM|nr:valine--tRNA ligase [Buchnera aphidicola]QCI26037.1 valine--tRNA ligase [Buchnera aphidicola (Sarucallis kahawaluokalani)]
MKKKYNPKDIEEKLYTFWEKNGFFIPKKNINAKNFCIVMPPPNITGNLHIGHAFQQTIMDILIRYHRMQGYNTLWQMGVDHAGIATQMLVAKQIKLKYNCNLKKFGRKNFIEKCLEWKNKNDHNIFSQIKRLGSSVDWSRLRFTLDDISQEGVRKVFIDLYNNDFIYRNKKLSYWDIKLKTVLSDLEIEHRTVKGDIWNIKYFLSDAKGKINHNTYLVISTTRPETLFGDTAIAVHPKDTRYTSLVGSFVTVPIVNRIIPIISDNFVDMNKGTGCVKITPAHDFNDYNFAIRHKIPMINIFTEDCKISNTFDIYDIYGNKTNIYNTDVPVQFQGLTRSEAKKKIFSILNQNKLLVSMIHSNITRLYGDRSGSEVECILTNQWYLRTKKLSKIAIQVVQENKIIFYPKQYKNLYLSWMHNIQDWCISRQLWWGHRIPVWYDILGNIYVGNNEIEIRKKYNISNKVYLTQESDVLDTWFSSSLWSFLSLDWPRSHKLIQLFHPTNVLVSGFDIIFFWVARMIMMTLYCIKDDIGIPQVPFKHVYITGLIKDISGKKMSKSHGNVLDPLHIIDGISGFNTLNTCVLNDAQSINVDKIPDNFRKIFPQGFQGFGADVLRITLASFSSITRDIILDKKQLQGYRNFCNKIWNASRLIFLNVKLEDIILYCDNNSLYFFNNWISLELNNTIKIYRTALDSYRFDIAINILYDFFWNKFCNWYLEIFKLTLKMSSLQEVQSMKFTLIYIFEIFLRLSHPVIPFITEYIWKKLKKFFNITTKTIMLQKFPKFNIKNQSNQIIEIMQWLQKIVLFLRNIRSKLKNYRNILFRLFIVEFDIEYKKIIFLNYNLIKKIGILEEINFTNGNHIPDNAIIEIINHHTVFVVFNIKIFNLINSEKKVYKINKLNEKILNLKKTLSNKKFLQNAPKKVIRAKKEKLKKLTMYKNELL